jgi:AhpD family alkylhydroperoxidase
MEPRLNLLASPVTAQFVKHIVAAAKILASSTLPPSTRELVNIRASQINGCSGCVDMHTKEAAHSGEDSTRLHLVAAWREATVFTNAERAALALTEEGTRLADGRGVADEIWENAAKHFDEEQLAALVCTIALINAFNRGNVITQQPAGSYQPGRHP